MGPENTEALEEGEIVGYGPAAEYLGLKPNTLSGYVNRGIGPVRGKDKIEGQYVRPTFTRDELDRWKASRPGQGARTDLIDKPAA